MRNTSDSAFAEVISAICAKIDTPRSRELSLAWARQSPVPKWFPSLDSANATTFANDYFVSKILSKYKGWKVKGVSSKRAALIGWESDELQNSLTNKRLNGLRRGTGFPGSDLCDIISMSQYHVAQVLGRFDLKKVLRGCRWGPGATSDYRNGTLRDEKLTQRMSCTASVRPLMKILIESDPNWIEAITGFYPDGRVSLTKDFWKMTDASRFTTVPKDWDIDRCIDMQPTANSYLQQGVGRYIRSRLNDFGINLDSQKENQDGAFRALSQGLATLDLKSASDSVTCELVSLLLPNDWSEYLFSLRTKYTQVTKDRKVQVEKFSAMGNAFTFELETLIFWAVAKSCCSKVGVDDGRVLVYGDDIVTDASAYDMTVYALNYLGFRVNESKSFRSGPFFESCGKHFFQEVDVTPVYQKKLVTSPGECVRMANRLVRWSTRVHGDPGYFAEAILLLIDLFNLLIGSISERKNLPLILSTTDGDDGFVVHDETLIKRDVHGGYKTTVLRPTRNRYFFLNNAAYLHLKLNDHAHSNGDPRGYPMELVGDSRWRLKTASFYR